MGYVNRLLPFLLGVASIPGHQASRSVESWTHVSRATLNHPLGAKGFAYGAIRDERNHRRARKMRLRKRRGYVR